EEIVIDIARDHPSTLIERLKQWAGRIGKNRIRLAMPALTRSWEDKGLRSKITQLRHADWNRWEAANLSAWSYLGIDPARPSSSGLDLVTDWSIYVLNRLAALRLLEMGAGRFALSPEDGIKNLRALLAEFSRQAVVIV